MSNDVRVHDLGIVLNSLYYCPDGDRHRLRKRRWWWGYVCLRCGERS